jgi:hypothetical protein
MRNRDAAVYLLAFATGVCAVMTALFWEPLGVLRGAVLAIGVGLSSVPMAIFLSLLIAGRDAARR